MLTVTFVGPRDFRIEEVPDPVPARDEVVVRVRAAGICGGDLHEYRAGRRLYPTPYPRPAQGHELAGEVSTTGEGVTSCAPGDRVAVQPMVSCRACVACVAGRFSLCTRLEHIGVARPGGFAELCLVPAENVFRLPPAVDIEEGALLDCTAVAVHALRRVPVGAGDRVAVLGAGAIGLAVAQAATDADGDVTVVGTRRAPLDLARELGAGAVANLGAGETAPTDADVVFETAGGPTALARALAASRAGGSIGLVGEAFDAQPLDLASAMARELTLAFVWSHDGLGEYDAALGLAARGAVRLVPAITHRYPLTEIETAFAAASERDRSGAIKVLVTP